MLNHNTVGILSASNSVILILKKLFSIIISVFYKVLQSNFIKNASKTAIIFLQLINQKANHKNL